MFEVPVLVLPLICVLAILLSVAVVIELRTDRIPNWLNLAGVFSGLVLMIFDHQWALHLTGFVVGFAIGIFLLGKGYAPAGFSKLLIAIGTVTGPVIPLISLIVGCLLMILGYSYSKIRKRRENTFDVPEELEHPEQELENQRNRRGLIKGSLFLSFTTILGLLILFQPWK
ncbi:prepilin peptidase [Gimesia panareensis]|uniref:prepilin peptidase n=1 Tax=Gimesia panareensis TaxID=2527978 RepID=UPI00118A4221|nr:A24 family peptidase [Gimesia panareensis]QDU52074.1 Type IV leader peptidase family protein [Gimesia panareensis]